MIEQVQELRDKLADAGKQRGRLTRIAADSGVSYRTIYALLHTLEPKPSAATVDKLAAYFKKVDKRAKA